MLARRELLIQIHRVSLEVGEVLHRNASQIMSGLEDLSEVTMFV